MRNSVSMIDGHMDYDVTIQDVLNVVKNKSECIVRQYNGECNNRGCEDCDLRVSKDIILQSYKIIESILQQEIDKPVIDRQFSYDGEYGTCPRCGTIVSDYTDLHYCSKCKQELDWSI